MTGKGAFPMGTVRFVCWDSIDDEHFALTAPCDDESARLVKSSVPERLKIADSSGHIVSSLLFGV